MPYGTITVTSGTYEPRQPGTYQKSGIDFGAPSSEFRIKGATTPGKDGLLRASVIRVVEKDLTVGSNTSRKAAIASLNLTVPQSGFTATELDALALDISEFVTAAIVSRLLVGEV